MFGSVIRDYFGAESDVDLVAELRPDARFGLFELVDRQDGLTAIVGRKAETIEFRALRPWMQEEVARSVEVFYGSSD